MGNRRARDGGRVVEVGGMAEEGEIVELVRDRYGDVVGREDTRG